MLLAAVTAVTMMCAGSVTAGAVKITKNPSGTTSVSYEASDWYLVYDPNANWTIVADGTIRTSFSNKVLEIHMPKDLYDFGCKQVSEGNIFEILAAKDDNYICWHSFSDGTYNAFVKKDGESYHCFERFVTDAETKDKDGFYSEAVLKLLLADDCPDSVLRDLESEFSSGDVYLYVSYFKEFGDDGTYLLSEKISYSVRGDDSEESASSQIVLKKTTLTAKRSGDKIKLSWKKVDGAEKYQIYYREKGESKYKKLATVSGSKTSYSASKLDKSKTYQFKIRSYAESNGEKIYSKFSKVKTVASK